MVQGLERIPKDGWAAHALAHVYEMEGRADEGIARMSKTVQDWSVCDHLACHNYWHWALYHIEKGCATHLRHQLRSCSNTSITGELDAAADIFETEILRRSMQSKTMLDIVDCASLPFRMKLEDETGERNFSDIKH